MCSGSSQAGEASMHGSVMKGAPTQPDQTDGSSLPEHASQLRKTRPAEDLQASVLPNPTA